MENSNTFVFSCIFIADSSRIIRTTIINKKQLPIGIGLRHDAVDAPLQILRSVVNRDYYTDFSHIAYNEKKKSPQASASARNCIAIRRRPSTAAFTARQSIGFAATS